MANGRQEIVVAVCSAMIVPEAQSVGPKRAKKGIDR